MGLVMSDVENRIAEVLEAHSRLHRRFGGEVICECGESLGSYRKDQFQAIEKDCAAHQAAMLAPLIAEAQAVAWDEGGEAMLNYIENQHTGIDPDRSPYETRVP